MPSLSLAAQRVRLKGNSTRCLQAVLGLIVAALSAGPAWAATASLTPLKDNTLVQQPNPAGQLSSGQSDIFAGRTNQDGQGQATVSIRRGLIAFDIAGSVPAGATITGATLSMRFVMGQGTDQSVALHRLSQDWGEGASTNIGAAAEGDSTWLYTFFSAANPASSPTWTTLGGNYSATPSASTIIPGTAAVNQLFSWSSATNPQMLADVQQWLANPATNFGWAMIGNEAAGSTAKRFTSGEGAVPPVLEITYTIPEPSALALVAAAIVGPLARGRRRSAWRR